MGPAIPKREDRSSQSKNFKEPSRAFACGKVILVGEHAVVYGAHAVAIPVHSMKLEIVLEETQSPQSSRKKLAQSENLQHVLQDAMALLKIEAVDFKVEGHSKILLGAGLGASAALCVCILRALSQYFNKPLEDAELASLANQLEKRFHGTPSGLDTAIVAYEKALLFAKGDNPQCLQVSNARIENKNHAWHFAIIDSDTRSPTLGMVQQAAPYFQGVEGQERIRRFDSAALQSAYALEEGDCKKLQDAMEEANVLLHEIGVVPPLLQEMIVRAKNCGALSAKVTGAGGGGCVLCLLDPRSAEETMKLLRHEFGNSKVHELVLVGS